MTREEFTEYIREFGATFPSWFNWFKRTESPKSTADAWFASFEDYSVVDCQRIIPLMRDDHHGYEPLQSIDYENFPRIIPRYVRKWKFENETPPEPEEPIQHAGACSAVTTGSMGEEFRFLCAAIEKMRMEHPYLSGKEVTALAVDHMGGILPDDYESALKHRQSIGLTPVERPQPCSRGR